MTSQNVCSRKPRKWNLPLTYAPKIEAVKAGTCTQTIRTGRKFKEGDLIRFYTWSGKPYRSKRETITEYMSLVNVFEIDIQEEGIVSYNFDLYPDAIYEWGTSDASRLAELNGIVPPTGEALRDVLISKNGKIPPEGIEAQIIRWKA